MSMLTITDLHACVITDEGETPILRGVSLVVESGKTNAIMGPNGSGKAPWRMSSRVTPSIRLLQVRLILMAKMYLR